MTQDTEHDHDDEAVGAAEAAAEEEEAAESQDALEGALEPSQEPAEASAPSETTPEQWEERFRKAEIAFKAYRKKVEALWEDDVTHILPFMISPSAPYGYVDSRDAGRLPDDLKESILTFVGVQREQDYEPDPFAEQCATCKGKGKTGLPTSVAGEQSRTCPTCQGHGYLLRETGGGGGSTNGVVPPDTPQKMAPDIQTGEVDAWGELRILPDGRPNPNFGKLPEHKVQVEPYGVTRMLTQTV